MARNKTALQKAREAMGFPGRRVAEAVRMDVSGLLRIETTENVATQKTARKIYDFFKGVVPIGVIYDPNHRSSHDWFKAKGTDKQLAKLARQLAKERPELEVRILDPRLDARS